MVGMCVCIRGSDVGLVALSYLRLAFLVEERVE